MIDLRTAGLWLASEAEVSAAEYTGTYAFIDPELLLLNAEIDYSDDDIWKACNCYLIKGTWYYEVSKDENGFELSECTWDMIEDLNYVMNDELDDCKYCKKCEQCTEKTGKTFGGFEF